MVPPGSPTRPGGNRGVSGQVTVPQTWSSCPILGSVGGIRAGRLALAEATGRTLSLGLTLLGIDLPEEM